MVMKERDHTRPLGGRVKLDDAYRGGERRGGKSGRGAPGRTPFVAAVELNDEGRPMPIRLSRVGGFRSEEIAAWARCHPEPGAVVVSDAVSRFRAVQQERCFHQRFATGSGAQGARHPALTSVNTVPGNVRCSFHGASNRPSVRHLPRYLAESSTRLSRRFSPGEMFPRLTFVAMPTAPMPYRVLKLAGSYFRGGCAWCKIRVSFSTFQY